ncbi:MAG: FG-GAP repeat protein, partial [Bacteroidia bacterium]|nr:FG-GAP repeat protein [Bacteroidia bacterium]
MWPIKFSGFSWLGVTILTILVWSNLKNQTILSAGINKLSPIVVYAEKENTKKDTLPFTQDNWLQKVQQDIASRECHINFAADKKYHQSPNRANNTRITYYPKSIQIAPRTIEEYEAIPPTELKAEKEISKTYEDYTLQLEVKGYGTTKKIIHPFQAEKLISENNEAFAKDDHMQVEYINNEEGTRQNFIIQQPIAGNELAVHLNINTSLTATQENEGSIKFTGKQNSTQLYYNDLKVWDATGKILPAQMKLSNVGQAYALVLAVNTAGAEYPITIDPIVTSGNLTNADWKVETNSASSFMGNSVSSAGDVNGDGYSDVIVAAYGRTSSFTSEGAVYIYHGSATGLSTSANRTILGGAANLWFGSKVATAGDINADGYSDVLIGSDNYTNGQTNEGAVYIYHGSASGIAATPTSIVESNVTSANMGREVSTAGDVNGDGYSDIVIGAESFDNGQTAEGAFWIYQGSAS